VYLQREEALMSSDFCHLHVHSEYSLLDGLGRTKHLAAEAARLEQPALALTDHGVMHGAIEFFRNCKKEGIKPIIGVEAYLTPFGRSMTDRDPHKDKLRHHLLLLAQNMTGYKNLLKICSEAQLDGYYYKPRIDADYLAAHAEGLICTSGCMAGEIPWLLNPEDGRPPQPDLALKRLHWYLEVFGRERFFIELQEHNIPALTAINKRLLTWAKQYDIGLLVTNDVHYVRASDAKPHDTLLCVQTSALVKQPNRLRMSDNGYYLKSLAEMRATFRALTDLPESAFTNSLKIAEMCTVDLEDDRFHLPDLPDQPVEVMPSHFAATKDYPGFLRYLTEQGLQERYGQRANTPEIQERKEHELTIINRMGFAVYYLIVWDLCRYARQENIWWNVRGSGAGSIVAYAIGITLIDPLRHNLIFERFLNPGRISMPDFDLDYPDDQRNRMIEYTRARYGDKRVAQIVSFGRMKARAAIRDVGRAMDIPLSEVDVLAKYIAAIPGKPATIDDTLDAEHEFFSPELKAQVEGVDHVQELVEVARNLEGVARHASVHAAAVIITDRDLTEYVPVMRGQGSVITEAVTQFEFPVCESIGLLKVDFLGLSTLTIMRKAAELIKSRHGLTFTLENLPMDNPEAFKDLPDFPPPAKAFDLLASGDVTGIFQVEGSGMRRVLTDMKPTRFEHIVAAISLFRPGPMEYIPTYIGRMHGQEPVEFKHPQLEPILSETFGIIVYQEQIIQIAAQLAGYAPGEADQIRKAVGKKIKAKIDEHRSKFIQGAVDHGISQAVAEAIYGDIEFFARYGFNKAHAADYALVTCQTAYLKAHFPIEYMTALLTVEQGNTDKVGLLVGECRTMGLEVLPPNVNYGGLEFAIQDRAGQPAVIRFSLSAVKNVGEGPIKAIVSAREAGGPFLDLDDFCSRVDLRQVGRRALECLIKVGALDDFAPRHQLLTIIERMLNLSSSTHKAADAGQISMFDMANFDAPQTGSVLYPLPEADPISQKELLNWEKELAGTYISNHPIQRYLADIKAAKTTMLGDLSEARHEQVVTVAGLINSVRHHQTKKGDPMAFVEIEDNQTTCEIVVFPRAYTAYRDLLVEGRLIVVRGKVDAKGGAPKVLADTISSELTIVDAVTAEPAPPSQLLPLFVEANGSHDENALPAAKPSNGHGQSHRPASLTTAESVAAYYPAELSGPAPSPATSIQQPGRNLATKLHVTLPCTGDLATDKHRLKQLFQLITRYPGDIPFSIHLPNGNRLVQIDFPNHTTRYTPELNRQLVTLFEAEVHWDD
jgi:DNA polymerase-3 subunit alpha